MDSSSVARVCRRVHFVRGSAEGILLRRRCYAFRRNWVFNFWSLIPRLEIHDNFQSFSMLTSTRHQLVIQDARKVSSIPDSCVHLVVTSPPYPMIKMWDDVYAQQNKRIHRALSNGKGNHAFELMHRVLDKVWKEVDRTLAPGGICCINIGDSTRTIGGQFALYPNHQRIQQQFLKLGYQCLPSTLWRKVTNAPNKFMGSA